MWECTRDFEWFVTEYSGIVRVLLEFFGSAALSVIALAQVCAVSDGPGSRLAPGGRRVWKADRWTLFVRKPQLGALQIGVILNWMLLSVF